MRKGLENWLKITNIRVFEFSRTHLDLNTFKNKVKKQGSRTIVPQIITPSTISPNNPHLGQLHPGQNPRTTPTYDNRPPDNYPPTIPRYNYSHDILGLFIILVEFLSTKNIHVT